MYYVTAKLNARVQPLDRDIFYGDPLWDYLSKLKLGAVTGGGTKMADNSEGVDYCYLDIELRNLKEETLDLVVKKLELLGVPKGSRLYSKSWLSFLGFEVRSISFGQYEGLGLFLNYYDLPAETYKNSDVNHVIQQCNKLMKGIGEKRGHWEGKRETALYFYGTSYKAMKEAIDDFVATYPLCERARFEQIA